MANYHTLGEAEGVEHTNNVSDELMLGVRFDWLRGVGFAVTTLIRSNSAKPRIRQCLHLMAPGIPQFRKAVAHHNRVALPRFGDVHSDAVGVDLLMFEIAHEGLLSESMIAGTGPAANQRQVEASG